VYYLLEEINRKASDQSGFIHKNISVSAKKLILGYPWPENVRELHNTLLRVSLWSPDEEISDQDIAQALALTTSTNKDFLWNLSLKTEISPPDLVGELARQYLKRAME